MFGHGMFVHGVGSKHFTLVFWLDLLLQFGHGSSWSPSNGPTAQFQAVIFHSAFLIVPGVIIAASRGRLKPPPPTPSCETSESTWRPPDVNTECAADKYQAIMSGRSRCSVPRDR